MSFSIITLQVVQSILTNAELSKDSDFGVVMVVYENLQILKYQKNVHSHVGDNIIYCIQMCNIRDIIAGSLESANLSIYLLLTFSKRWCGKNQDFMLMRFLKSQ